MIHMFIHTQPALDNLLRKISEISPGGQVHDMAMREAGSSTLGNMIVRIHEEGKASDGSDIGTYSTKPIYINPKNSPVKFGTSGKYKDYTDGNGNRVLKPATDTFKGGRRAGEKHTTKYFDGGYKEFREDAGRDSSKVNLDLTGGLKQGLQLLPTSRSYSIGFMNDEQARRAEGLEKKYGKKIWSLTSGEKLEFVNLFSKAVKNAIRN